jgi:hypothetical protein
MVTTFNSFQGTEFSVYINNLRNKIRKEIISRDKNYILSIDEVKFKSYISDKYSLIPLKIETESEIINEPYITQETIERKFFGGAYITDVYNFTIEYRFSGTAQAFRLRPSLYNYKTYEVGLDQNKKLVSYTFKLYKKDPDQFLKTKNKVFKYAFSNIDEMNREIQNWNSELMYLADSLFISLKNKYLEENAFYKAINVKVNADTMTIFSPPTIKRKIIPQPSQSRIKNFISEPILSSEVYDDILKVIYNSGKSMEKKPSLYEDQDEEGLRNLILFLLETRYEGTTASGETFNRNGRTDICLKYAEDQSNVFVAECKFWSGEANYKKAIFQLFDNYLTWRDSKVALIVFVTNKDFTEVLRTIHSATKNHPYFKKSTGKRGESSFSYLMHLPQDENKNIYLEVISFHFDKIRGSH